MMNNWEILMKKHSTKDTSPTNSPYLSSLDFTCQEAFEMDNVSQPEDVHIMISTPSK